MSNTNSLKTYTDREDDADYAERERMDDEAGYTGGYNVYGRCPRHPKNKLVSDCGMFDTHCWDCEGEDEMDSRKIEWALNEMPVWCEGKSEAEIIAYVDKYDAEQEVLAQADAALAKANAVAADDDLPF
jgi:hypothetical protein